MSNTFGNIFRLTTFGESHGVAVGGVVDGMPAGVKIDEEKIQAWLNRRRPGQSKITTPRDEKDQVRLLSGVFEGVSTGHPIGFMVENTNQHSKDYSNIAETYRPSHADYTYETKYGIRDYRGGGRSSARETISRVVGGALASMMMEGTGISVTAYTSAVGTVELQKSYKELDLSRIEDSIVRCPDAEASEQMIAEIEKAKADKDSIGGVITCVVRNLPVGLGEPCFDKLQAMLAHAMLSIGAVKGFEYGSGFAGARMRGSEHNDPFVFRNGKVETETNNSGGIQGGISNGEDIYFRVAFKPTATILKEQQTVNRGRENVSLTMQGRHDPCVVPRAVPIVEAMTNIVLADAIMMNRSAKMPF
ncbi:MAG: chorismate synthase [Bacteroidales bacterium]|nr:chorismate synthase [Bacteroidales bacterium]